MGLILTQCVYTLDDGIDERTLEPTLQFKEDSLVKQGHFESIKLSKTRWKDEINALGETFMMFYEENSDKSKILIPKFDRSATLNAYPGITYVATNCKYARHFCNSMNLRGVPMLYYVQDCDHIYPYTSHYLHKFFQVFFRGNWKQVEPLSIDIFIQETQDKRQSEQKLFEDFQGNVTHIDNNSFDKLTNRNQLVVFYSRSSSGARDVIPIIYDMYNEAKENNDESMSFAAVNTQEFTDSISKVFKAKGNPLLIFVADTGKYVRYSGSITKEGIQEFCSSGYIKQALKKQAVEGDINDKLKEIADIEEKANTATGKNKRQTQEEKLAAQRAAHKKILEREEQLQKEKQQKKQQQQENKDDL